MNMASVTDGAPNDGRGTQRRGKTMRVSDFVSSSFDRFDQQYNTACSRANTSGHGPSFSANNTSHVLTTEGRSMSDAAEEDVPGTSLAHSILLDLLRRSNNDLQNYNGNTSLPLLLIALARVVIALLSLLLSLCGIVIHVLLAVTIRILFVVVDGVSFVQRVMWRAVERVVTKIAIRMEWQHRTSNNSRSWNSHHDNSRSNGNNHHHHYDSQGNTTSADNSTEARRGVGGRIFAILEPYRKHILQQLSSLIKPPTTTSTRNKLDTLPDIMNNTPPSLSLFALVTALAFIVHPDGLTWIVLGKLCEGVWLGLKLLRGAATAIVAAILSSSYPEGHDSGEGGGTTSFTSETLSTIVASAVLASLIMLGKVMYRALYKKSTVIDAQTTSTSSSSSSKKKKGRRGRNSGRHGNHHHNRSGHRNNRRDAPTESSTLSRTDSSAISTHQSKQRQPSRSQSRSLSPTSTRTNSMSSFVEEKETDADAIPKPKVTVDGDDEVAVQESKEGRSNGKEDNGSNSGNVKPSAVQQLPHDPAHAILSKLRPDSTDSLSVPQLLDEDASVGSSGGGSLVVDCVLKQGGGASRANTGSRNNDNSSNKKRGGTRGKYNGGGPTSANGSVRTPPGFISKDSTSSSTKSATHPRNKTANSRGFSGKNTSTYERNDDRKQRQPNFPQKKSRDSQQHYGTRTRASTSDCVIREHEVHSSPLFSDNNSTRTAEKTTSPTSSLLLPGHHRLQNEQRVRIASVNELSSTYQTSNQVQQEPTLLNNGSLRNNVSSSPISPPVIRPPPGLGFGSPVEMNSFVHGGGVGGVELATTANNHRAPGPTLSLSSPERLPPQSQMHRYSSYDQSNFLLQPSVFPSMSNADPKMKETRTNEDEIDDDLKKLGNQMVGSVLDF